MKKLTRPMKEAARLLAEGKSLQEIALNVKHTEETVLDWMADPQVMALCRKWLTQSQVVHYARAVERIGGMIENESDAVAHRAAREALSKFEKTVFTSGDGPRTIEVHVTGMPEIGMPES